MQGLQSPGAARPGSLSYTVRAIDHSDPADRRLLLPLLVEYFQSIGGTDVAERYGWLRSLKFMAWHIREELSHYEAVAGRTGVPAAPRAGQPSPSGREDRSPSSVQRIAAQRRQSRIHTS